MQPHTRQRAIKSIVLAVLGLGIVALFVAEAGSQEVLASLRFLTWPVFFWATLLFLMGWPPRVYALGSLSKDMPMRLGMRGSASACLGANALNVVLPARLGDVLLVAGLSGDRDVKSATSLVVVWRLLSFLSLLVLVTVVLSALVLWPRAGPTGMVGLLLAYLVLTGLAAGVLAVMLKRSGGALRRLARAVASRRRWTRVSLMLGSIADATQSRVHVSRYAVAGTLLACSTLADALVGAAFVLALVPGVPLVAAMGAPVVGAIGKLLRLTPSGIGVYEALFAAVLLAAGSSPAQAIAAAALSHGLLNLFTLVLGGPFALLLTKRGVDSTARLYPRRSAATAAEQGDVPQ